MIDRFDAAKHVETAARVQVTLDLKINGTWGPECAIGQVYVQAKDEAEGIVRRLFNGDGIVARIVGEPTVLSITNTGRAR